MFLYLTLVSFLLLLPSVATKTRACYLYTIICLTLVVDYSQLKNSLLTFIRTLSPTGYIVSYSLK
jgi:hypothetical protein